MLTVQRCTGDFVAGSDDAGRFGVLFANKKSARLTNDPLKEPEVIKQHVAGVRDPQTNPSILKTLPVRPVVNIPPHELRVRRDEVLPQIFRLDVPICAGAIGQPTMPLKSRLFLRQHWRRPRRTAQYPGRCNHPVLALRAVHRRILRPQEIVTHRVKIAR